VAAPLWVPNVGIAEAVREARYVNDLTPLRAIIELYSPNG
jgi:hypothetical protein